MLAGGVAPNKQIRFTLKKLCQEEKFNIYYPKMEIQTHHGPLHEKHQPLVSLV